MSNYTQPLPTGEPATSTLPRTARPPGCRRSPGLAQCRHAPQLPRRLAPLLRVGRPRGSRRHAGVTGDGGSVPCRTGRQRPVAHIAPLGPRRDSATITPTPDTRTWPIAKACAGCCADSPAGRRGRVAPRDRPPRSGEGTGRDPCKRLSAAHGTGRSNRAGQQGPPPR